MKTILFLIISTLSYAQVAEKQIADRLVRITDTGGKTAVTFLRTDKYNLEFVTLPAEGDFTDVARKDLSSGLSMRVDNAAMFYFIGSDTVSLVVMSPIDKNHLPVVALNGVDLRTGKKIAESLWRYEDIIEK